MVMSVQPWYKAVKKISRAKISGKKLMPDKGIEIIMLTPRGRQFNQKMAQKLVRAKQIIFICGRYEGVDERVAQYIATSKVSIGGYDLMGGELAAMVIAETVARLIPDVIGKPEFLKLVYLKKDFLKARNILVQQYFHQQQMFNGACRKYYFQAIRKNFRLASNSWQNHLIAIFSQLIAKPLESTQN